MQHQNHLTGLITPISWSSENQVMQYSLYTNDGEDILLEGRNGLNSRLAKYNNKLVHLSGFLKRMNQDCRMFNVTHISPIKNA